MNIKNSKLLRYKEILTKELLEEEYLKNKKSILQLKRELDKDWHTIKFYLGFYNIPRRTHKEQASISSPGGEYMYDEKLTKDYLIEKYLVKKKGIKDISKELKIDRGTVRRYLRKYNIQRRTSKQQNNINNPPKEFVINKAVKSFIDGLLLGDASIPRRKDGIKPRSFTQACKHKEYLDYIRNRLNNLGILSSPILSRWINDDRCKNKGYNQHFLQTRRYKTFEIFRGRWYPKGKKIIPRDILITQETLLQVYICDGNFYREIRLCLDAFDKEEIYFLKDLIEKKLEIKLRATKINQGYELFIKKSDTNRFLNYLGKPPVECYAYKWGDNETEEAKNRKRLKARLLYHKNKNELRNLP